MYAVLRAKETEGKGAEKTPEEVKDVDVSKELIAFDSPELIELRIEVTALFVKLVVDNVTVEGVD